MQEQRGDGGFLFSCRPDMAGSVNMGEIAVQIFGFQAAPRPDTALSGFLCRVSCMKMADHVRRQRPIWEIPVNISR